jgi:hypothetical protein
MSREVDRRSFSTTKLNLERETVLPNIATEVSKALPGQQRIRIERFDAVTGNPSEITAEDTLPEEGNFVERALDYVNNLRNVLSPTVISQVEFVPDSISFSDKYWCCFCTFSTTLQRYSYLWSFRSCSLCP